jgi:hypothetical protein
MIAPQKAESLPFHPGDIEQVEPLIVTEIARYKERFRDIAASADVTDLANRTKLRGMLDIADGLHSFRLEIVKERRSGGTRIDITHARVLQKAAVLYGFELSKPVQNLLKNLERLVESG